MLDKIEIGKIYIDSDGDNVTVTAIGRRELLYMFDNEELYGSINMAKKTWSELPKSKVKRARYLYKSVIDDTLPVCTNTYYKDVNDFLKGRCSKKDAYIFIKKLNETEREFDV